MAQALAIKYRPKSFEDVVEQGSIRTILQQQLESNEWKHAYLFCGGAGTGKTTCARIFANELNEGEGNPVELDAASNNGVDDVREIIQQAKTKALDSEYKVFIIDECHALSNSAWQAMLKLIEEPPAKSIFIFCTTDPQKIPKTILSRVQRYDFQRISQFGIVQRLKWICDNEGITRFSDNGDYEGRDKYATQSALEYIAKIADGGMRDAISLLDKCLSYNNKLTLQNVVDALGTVDYDVMIELTDSLLYSDRTSAIALVEGVHNSGKDIKQFVKQYVQFLLDVSKYGIGCDWQFISIPRLQEYEEWLKELDEDKYESINYTLDKFITLSSEIKYSATPKYDVEGIVLTM